MQSSLSLSSNSPPINCPWKSNSIGIHLHHRNLIFAEPRFSSKAPSLWSSLVTPCRYKFAKARDGGGPSMAAALPVAIRRSGRVSRYFWDGSELRLVCVDVGALGIPYPPEDGLGFSKLFRDFNSAVWDFLIPRQVPENYIPYVKWKFLHRVFSSALQVLATQAMFRAIGIGYSHSLPSAAALNWVLKDGLGRLCRCIYTASLACAFDTNLKSVRLTTSVLFSLSIGVELLTPIFPQYFLLLASLANIAKQISLACYLATGSTVHRSFAISGNIGEVSAKSQIQTVCFDNLGLMLAALLNILFKDSHRLQAGLPLVVYPTFSAIDLLGIFQGLKHVHLQTLTKCRLLIILKTWIECNYVPSPKEVSREEGINFPCSKGRERWPIRIGCLNPKCQIPELSAKTLRSLTRKDFKFICMEIVLERLSRTEQQGILLCVREGASSGDIQMGLLQASYIRRALISNKWDEGVKASCSSDRVFRDWFELVEDSKLSAEQDLAELNKQMVAQGWAVDNVLLSSDEQARYSFLDE